MPPVDTFGGPALNGTPVPQAAPAVPIQATPQQIAARTAAATPSPVTAAPSSPAVLSSGTIANEVIPANNAKLDDLSKKGTYVAGDGKAYYSDGSLVPAPVGAEYNPQNGAWVGTDGKQYGAAPQFVTGDDEEAQKTNDLIASMKMSLDGQTLAQVNNIQQQYDMLRSQQQDANNRADSSRQQTLLVGGGARYAPLASAGITLAQTSFGLQQIQKLDADENSAITAARAAQTSGDFQLMDKALATVAATRQAKQDAAQKVSDQLAKANADILSHNQQIQRDESVAQIMAAGVTDPTEAFNALRAAGVDITADDVKKVFDNLTPKTTDTSVYKFTNSDVGQLLAAGINSTQIHALSAYYNGTGDDQTTEALKGLSSAQQQTVYGVLGGKTASAGGGGGSGGGETSFTSTQINKGAANAGVPLTTFQGYDQDAQNIFINGDIAGTKKTIDKAFTDGGSVDDVNKSIDDLHLPPQVTQYFKDYAAQSGKTNAPLTPEQQQEQVTSVLKDLLTGGYSDAEAEDAVNSQLTNGGKTALPEVLKNAIAKAMDEVYGPKTIYQGHLQRHK